MYEEYGLNCKNIVSDTYTLNIKRLEIKMQ